MHSKFTEILLMQLQALWDLFVISLWIWSLLLFCSSSESVILMHNRFGKIQGLRSFPCWNKHQLQVMPNKKSFAWLLQSKCLSQLSSLEFTLKCVFYPWKNSNLHMQEQSCLRLIDEGYQWNEIKNIFIRLFVLWFVCSFIHSLIQPSIHSWMSVHISAHTFTHSFII